MTYLRRLKAFSDGHVSHVLPKFPKKRLGARSVRWAGRVARGAVRSPTRPRAVTARVARARGVSDPTALPDTRVCADHPPREIDGQASTTMFRNFSFHVLLSGWFRQVCHLRQVTLKTCRPRGAGGTGRPCPSCAGGRWVIHWGISASVRSGECQGSETAEMWPFPVKFVT